MEEGGLLEKHFNKAAGSGRKLNIKQFKKLYLKLIPNSNKIHTLKMFDSIAGIKNITFDKFLGFYAKCKSSPEDTKHLKKHNSLVPYSPAGIAQIFDD